MPRTEVLIIPSDPLFLPISGNDPRYTQFSEQGWTPSFPYFFLQAITQSILAQILSQPIQSSPTHFSAPGLQRTSSGLPQHPLNHCIPSNQLTTLQQGKVPLQIWPHHTPLHVLLWIPSASYDEGQNTSMAFQALHHLALLLLYSLLSSHFLHSVPRLLLQSDFFLSLSLSTCASVWFQSSSDVFPALSLLFFSI